MMYICISEVLSGMKEGISVEYLAHLGNYSFITVSHAHFCLQSAFFNQTPSTFLPQPVMMRLLLSWNHISPKCSDLICISERLCTLEDFSFKDLLSICLQSAHNNLDRCKRNFIHPVSRWPSPQSAMETKFLKRG